MSITNPMWVIDMTAGYPEENRVVLRIKSSKEKDDMAITPILIPHRTS
eukprot:CAMPEP_0204643914 /NCGR_PEP_ID=MMETSP0718-20130828/1070_1 /ASSEMBLY_ACC=CAM_ASM_000674 /TAXON_ID=230516 /ORGANISM="Chaetoceros curvisetus" /LENGTH=47 /DNA_ID= /DNA_START= /DNA_END= /DNA_ORIENTATION=